MLKLTNIFKFASRHYRIHFCLRAISNGSRLGAVYRWWLRRYHIEIGNGTCFGAGLILPHPQNIIIGKEVIIGRDVHIGQNVTIGGNQERFIFLPDGSRREQPTVGDRCCICANAVVAGPIVIGDEVLIGANAVVTRDIPSNTMVYGFNQLSRKRISIDVKGGTYNVIGQLEDSV